MTDCITVWDRFSVQTTEYVRVHCPSLVSTPKRVIQLAASQRLMSLSQRRQFSGHAAHTTQDSEREQRSTTLPFEPPPWPSG